jgi:hypothetical protein
MKKTLIFTITLFTFLITTAQDSGKKTPEITFDKLLHDFGTVYQGDKTEYDFTFRNTGNQPLIISDVKSTCGCTVPEWPRNPILPGSSASIKVKYNSNIVGPINRQITILSNAANSPSVLRVAGSVDKIPSEILPLQQKTSAPVPSGK